MSNKILGYIVVCILLIIFLWVGYWLGFVDGRKEKEISLLPQETYTAEINGRNTLISDYGDYKTFSINYSRCVPLKFMDACRWDRENFRVKWDQ